MTPASSRSVIEIIRREASDDLAFHVHTGVLSAGDIQTGLHRLPEARMILPAGLQGYFELVDPQRRLGLQLMRYKAGTGDWRPAEKWPAASLLIASGSRLDPDEPGCWRWMLALRNTSRLITGSCVPLTATVNIRTRKVANEEGFSLLFPSEAPQPRSQDTLTRIIPDDKGLYWVSGDLHQHSSRSDGLLSPVGLHRLNQQNGLDFMAITDHQVFQAGSDAASPVVMSGLELTTPFGHLNVIGLKNWSGLSIGDESDAGFGSCGWMQSLAARWKEQGALIVMNHPCFPPWHWRCPSLDRSCFDAMEIICDPEHPDSAQASDRALRLWSSLLNQGWSIIGLAGSDFHGSSGQPGWPTVHVGCPWRENTPEDMIRAVKTGCVSVGCGFRPELILDSRASCQNLRWKPVIHTSQAGGQPVAAGRPMLCQLVFRGDVTDERVIRPGEDPAENYSAWLPEQLTGPQQSDWLRLDCRNMDRQLTGFTNPVSPPARLD